MFLKGNCVRVLTFARCGTRRLICSERSSEAETVSDARVLQNFNDIPTAKRLPLIGTKMDFLRTGFGKRFHEYIDSQHRSLGAIFREPVGGGSEVVFINSADMMREMFVYEGKYPKHPLPDAWTLYNETHNCKRGLFFMDDEEWLANRKIMNAILLRNDFQAVHRVIESVSDDLITDWNRNTENMNKCMQVTDLMAVLYTWAIKVLVLTMIGDAHRVENSKINQLLPQFCRIVQDIFERTAPLMVIPPTFAQKYNLKIWTEFEKSVTKTLEIANEIVEVGLKMDGNGLLKEMQSNNMSTETMKRIFVDLIIAAGDTTAYTTQWTLFLLSSNNSEQSKIRSQLNSNYFETPLIRGTVKESLRLFPVATFIGRILPADGVIGNYRIPQHTPVIASMYSIGRDAKNFPNPNEFQPSRWLRNSSGNMQCVHRPNMPYAMGVRSCVGQKFANAMMHVLLSKILANFELKLLNDKPVGVVMRLIAVPTQPIMLGIKRLS